MNYQLLKTEANLEISTPKKLFLYCLPVILLISTAGVFTIASGQLGKPAGYVIGFVFYDGFWCLLVPWLLLGKRGFSSLFREESLLLQKGNWWLIFLLISTTAGALGMLANHDLGNTPLMLVVLALPVAIITGTCEEILWRGLYVKMFPQDVWLGLFYPALGFAVWHLSPQLVFPASMPGGMAAFAGMTFFLGLCYGLVAFRTGSCKWTAASHSVNGILDLGGALAPALYSLFFHIR